jgi:hypothetical protein
MQLKLLVLSLATAAAALPYGNLPRENPMPAPPAAKPQDAHATRDNHMPSPPAYDEDDDEDSVSTQDNHIMRRDNNMPSPPSAEPQDNHATRRDNQMPAPPVDNGGD